MPYWTSHEIEAVLIRDGPCPTRRWRYSADLAGDGGPHSAANPVECPKSLRGKDTRGPKHKPRLTNALKGPMGGESPNALGLYNGRGDRNA